jgi:hypothetical protein
MDQKRGREALTALSGVGAWLVPAWGCPVCLSAFAGTMSALGLGFVATKAVLTPLTGLLLGVALISIGFGAKRRGAYGALWLGISAAGLLVGSKFLPGEPWIGYAGLAALLAACVWNGRTAAARPCAFSLEASPTAR